MTTLALDLGQSIGWVKGKAVGPLTHGTLAMPTTTDLGAWLQASDPFFMEVMKDITDIAVEQPFLGDSYFPARKLLALLGHVYYHARFKGIAAAYVNEIPVPTAKKALTGHGFAEKDLMIEKACEFWGFEPDEIDEHQADASAILKVHLFGEAPKLRPAKVRSGKGKSLLRGAPRG